MPTWTTSPSCQARDPLHSLCPSVHSSLHRASECPDQLKPSRPSRSVPDPSGSNRATSRSEIRSAPQPCRQSTGTCPTFWPIALYNA
ncbi:hypothetical protein BCV70DRAFT_64186 [Testicularia cyperi]|uniref:Uncharacterized protein n=1 Tax=Testicularia cyperi TaxID=1882483 RepID=A0A317XVY9_9BASI|nr:hypothetical protein BCV70DRAFT_64186 [Testicularia cyperi]